MMQVFPVKTGPQTKVQFAQRFGETHQGTDIFGPAGAELVAVADGVVRQAKEDRGGFAVYLTEEDGSQYYYAHLDAFANPLMPGETRRVKVGDLLGYMGTSGNATGKAPHLHFEWRPGGGNKRDPFSALTRLARLEEQRLAKAEKPKPAAKNRSRRGARKVEKRRTDKAAQQRPMLAGGGGGVLLLVVLWFLSKGRKA